MNGIVNSVYHSVSRALRIRSDRVRLHDLPDYLLRDIGISRSEIDSVTMFGGSDPTRRPRS